MIIAINSNESREYTSIHDADENKTIFILGVLDNFVRAKIEDMTTRYSIPNNSEANAQADIQINYNQRNLKLVQYGLKGWKNFKDDKGNDIEFNTTSVNEFGKSYNIISDKSLRRLPKNIILELAGQILEDNFITEESKKK